MQTTKSPLLCPLLRPHFPLPSYSSLVQSKHTGQYLPWPKDPAPHPTVPRHAHNARKHNVQGDLQGVWWVRPFTSMRLESVDLDQILLCQLVAHKERGHILSLIPLQLDDLAQLLIIHHVAVAAELCTINYT